MFRLPSTGPASTINFLRPISFGQQVFSSLEISLAGAWIRTQSSASSGTESSASLGRKWFNSMFFLFYLVTERLGAQASPCPSRTYTWGGISSLTTYIIDGGCDCPSCRQMRLIYRSRMSYSAHRAINIIITNRYTGCGRRTSTTRLLLATVSDVYCATKKSGKHQVLLDNLNMIRQAFIFIKSWFSITSSSASDCRSISCHILSSAIEPLPWYCL